MQVCFFIYLKVTSKKGVPEVSIIHFCCYEYYNVLYGFAELIIITSRSSHRKKRFLESLFNKVSGLQACNFFKKDSNKGVFLGILRIFLKNLFWKSSASTVSVFHFIPLRYSPASLEWVFEQKSYPFHISYLLSSIYLYAKIMQK